MPTDAADKLLVTVVTYNERESLPVLIPLVLQYAEGADVLVVDDNSPDGTGQWCDEFARSEPRVRCLHRPEKGGVGSATVVALRYAIEQGYDLAINLDADLSHPPSRIPDLLAVQRRLQVDVVIGSRYVSGGSVQGWPLLRRILSRLVNWYARWGLWLPVHDSSGAFRCFRVARLKDLDWNSIRASGYAFEEELLWRLRRTGADFAETPIQFVDRRHGASKTSLRESIAAVRVLLWMGLATWTPRLKRSEV